MPKVPDKTGGFRLWWAAWLIASLVMGFLLGAREDAVGGYQIWFALYAADGALMLGAFHLMMKRVNRHSWAILPVAFGVIILGALIGDWLVNVVE